MVLPQSAMFSIASNSVNKLHIKKKIKAPPPKSQALDLPRVQDRLKKCIIQLLSFYSVDRNTVKAYCVW